MVGSVIRSSPATARSTGCRPAAPGLDWLLNHPTNLLLAPDGSILVVAWHNHKLLDIDPDDGFVQGGVRGGAGFAGDGQLAATSALFRQVNDASLDEAGQPLPRRSAKPADPRIDTAGIITTIAGTGTVGYSGDGGPALDATVLVGGRLQPQPQRRHRPPPGQALRLGHRGRRHPRDRSRHGHDRSVRRDWGAGLRGRRRPRPRGPSSGPRATSRSAPTATCTSPTPTTASVRAIDLETGLIRTVVGTGELGLDEVERLPATETHFADRSASPSTPTATST
jgi:hypothetical protein